MPSEVKTREHQWVKMVIVPIEVLTDGDGKPVVFVDPQKQEGGEEHARYGCFACSEPLETGLGTECQAP